MKIKATFQLFALLFILFILNFSASMSRDGRNNNLACSNCHGGGNPGTFTFTGVPDQVAPSTLYNAQICINDPVHNTAQSRGGFRFHSTEGTYSNLGANVRTGGSANNQGLTQSSPTAGNGTYCWTFDWTSPASGVANVQIYGNAVNGDSVNDNGDHGGYQIFKIIETVSPCISDLVITDSPILNDTYQSGNSIFASTPLDQNSNTQFLTNNLICLENGFEVPANANFEAVVGVGNGCLDEAEEQ